MILRAFDNFLGRGEAAVTVPPLDGALRPNRDLDDATARHRLDGVDSLAIVGHDLLAAAGDSLFALDAGGLWQHRLRAEAPITCIAPVVDSLAVALGTGDILMTGGAFDGRRYRVADGITAMVATLTTLYVAIGSTRYRPDDWQRDLLHRNATGSLWQVDLGTGKATRLADGLAWPAGLTIDEGGGLVFAEAWRHRLVRLDPASPARRHVLYGDLPGYPGRLSRSGEHYWLAVFAPRSQLVEFVLREPAYARRMMAEVPQPYWIAPKLRSGRSFYEPLQGGGVKHLGLLKPWAPSLSSGLCIRLDRGFQPVASRHSRADGHTHGITSIVERDGTVFAAARGDDVVVALQGA